MKVFGALFGNAAVIVYLTFATICITASSKQFLSFTHLLVASNQEENGRANVNKVISFGFASSKDLHDKIFSGLYNITTVDVDEYSTYDEVYTLPYEMKSPVAVGLVDSRINFSDEKLVNTNNNNLHLTLNKYIESVFRNSNGESDGANKARLVLIVASSSSSNFESIKSNLENLVDDIATWVPFIFKGKKNIGNVLDVIILNAADVASDAQAVKDVINNSGTERAVVSSSSSPIPILQRKSSNENGGSIENNLIADDFIADVKTSVAQMAAERIDSKSTEKIAQIINEATSRNYHAYESVLSTATPPPTWLKNSSIRARLELLAILKSLFAVILEAELVSSLESYEMAIKKVPPTKQLRDNLNKIASQVVDGFVATAKAVRKDMLKILTTSSNTAGGLFGAEFADCKLSLSDSISPSFGFSYELNALKIRLSRSIPEIERQLFVSGAYNPFIREAAFPPTRFNFNYLLNPKAALQSIGHDKIYDDNDAPNTGTTRADPLFLPGFARFPFDPNDNPVPKDNKPWYQILVDLYRN